MHLGVKTGNFSWGVFLFHVVDDCLLKCPYSKKKKKKKLGSKKFLVTRHVYHVLWTFVSIDRFIWLNQVTNLYDSQNKSIFVLILDLHGNETRFFLISFITCRTIVTTHLLIIIFDFLHITLTLENIITLYSHVNLIKKCNYIQLYWQF